MSQLNGIRAYDRVLVYGTLPGTVTYITADGYFGVNLDGEGHRVDEWFPSQVAKA